MPRLPAGPSAALNPDYLYARLCSRSLLLAIACAALAVGAPLVRVALERAVRTVTGVALRPVLLPGKLTVIPAHTGFSAFSPTYLAAFLVAVMAVPLLIYLAGRPRGALRTVPVWDGGMVAFKPRMQYSAMTFSVPTRITFDALYQPSVSLQRAFDDPAGVSGPVHYETQTTPIFQRYLYRPVIRAVERAADVVRRPSPATSTSTCSTSSSPSWSPTSSPRSDRIGGE